MCKEYSYYKTLLSRIQAKKPLGIDRINEIGGRMGSKTWSSLEFSIMACLMGNVKVDAFRWTKGKDRKELFDQFGTIIESYPGLMSVVEVHLTNLTYKFPNGSLIEVSGLRNRGSKEVQLTGKSGTSQYDYQIAIAEERYEITDEAWSHVQQALRGTKNYIEIHLANPWVFTNDYVSYCQEAMPFSIETLKKDGQQFLKREMAKTLMDGTKYKFTEVFHYSNYLVNEFIHTADKMKLELAAEHDPHRANTILYGFPGSPKGSIWKWVLPKMRQAPPEPSVKYVGGVDYGERADATAAYIIGFAPEISHAHIEHEYYHANKENIGYKDTNILASDVVDHYVDFIADNELQSRLDIYVDGSSIPFITALNTYAQKMGVDHVVSFIQQTDKGHVADRIENIKTMASFGLITVDEDCPELLRELTEQVYADKSRTSIDYIDGDDHGTDAIYYGLRSNWIRLMESMDDEMDRQVSERMEAERKVNDVK